MDNSSKSMIVGGARTPIGRFNGALSSLSAVDLGSHAISSALERSRVDPGLVDYVFMGHVLQSGTGQITARQAAVKAGIGMSVPATTINKVCLSSFEAIHLADLMIRTGEADVVVAGGMESMSQAPHLLAGSRSGFRYGDATLTDSMVHDGLLCPFDGASMGEGAERYGAEFAGQVISRETLDEFSVQSHRRSAAAQKAGRFDSELAPISVAQRKGEAKVVSADEGVRPEVEVADLARLRSAFAEGGIVTAGNASQISDGAAAVVMMSAAKAKALKLDVLGTVVGVGQVAGPDTSLLSQPSRAISKALADANVPLADLKRFEINEAFASVALASINDLGLDRDVVNVNGGAVALGHPLGATGARLVLTLLNELSRTSEGLGVAAACGGGGQGDAIIVQA